MYTNVSCFIGDDDHLINLLRVLAVRKGTKVGKLVREAIDEAYGSEIDELRPIFFAENGDFTHKDATKVPTKRTRLS